MAVCEGGGSGARCALEADAVEGKAFAGCENGAKCTQGFERVGHQAFAAGLIYRRLLPVEERTGKAALREGDGGGQPSRTATDDGYLKAACGIHSGVPATIMRSAALFDSSRRGRGRRRHQL